MAAKPETQPEATGPAAEARGPEARAPQLPATEPRAPEPPGPERRAPSGWLGLVAGLVVAVGLALWMVAGLWGPGAPSGDDTMAHLVRAEHTIRELLPRLRLDGWQPQFGLGYQQFLFYGPGFTWLVALVHGLGLGLLSIPGAFKVAAVLVVVVLPLAVAFLASSFGLDRRASGLAAILALCVSSPFGGIGLPGTFGAGLIPNQLGAALFCLAFGGILRVAADPRPRWVVFAGFATAAMFVTHAISAVILAAFLLIVLPTFLLTDRLSVPLVRRLAAAFGLAAGLSAFWLVPSFAHSDLRGILTSWPNPLLPERLHEILFGKVLYQRGVVWFVLVGLAYGLWRVRRRRRWALGLVAAPLVYLGIADLFLRWNPTNLVSLQLMNRGLGYAGVVAVLPLAALLSGMAARQPLRRVGEVGALACAAALVVASGAVREPVHLQEPTPQLRAMAAELSRVVPPSARFASQRDWPREVATAGVTHPDFWLAWGSGRNTLNIFNVESSTTPGPDYAPDRMTRQPPEEAADELLRLGVSHVALVNEESAREMLASPRFSVVWHSAPMAVLAIRPKPGVPGAPGGPPPGAPLIGEAGAISDVRPVRASAERLELDVRAVRPTTAAVAIAWSPKWHATVDGRPTPLGRDREGLLTLAVPAGASRVALQFRPDAWDAVGVAGSLLALAALAAWAAAPRAQRLLRGLSRPRRGGNDADS